MGVDESRGDEPLPVVVKAGLGVAGAEVGGFAHCGDASGFHGHRALRQDTGGGQAVHEGIAGEAENLAQEKIGHVAPF
jgi:hypothetical protein